MGGKRKEKQLPFPSHTKEGWKNRKTAFVEGEDEWRVAGEEILSFPAHNGLVSMTGQLQICFILSRLCVCSNGRLPVNWSLWRLLSRRASVCCPSHSSFRSTLIVRSSSYCVPSEKAWILSLSSGDFPLCNPSEQANGNFREKEGWKKEGKINLIPGSPVGRMTWASQRNDWYFQFCARHKRGSSLFDRNLFRNPYFSFAFTSVLYILSQILTSSAVIGTTESFMDCCEMIRLSNVPVGLPPDHCTYREEKPLISDIINSRH